MKRAVWALAIAVPVVVLLATGFRHDPNAIVSPIVNKPAPTFSLRAFDGKDVSLASLRGKPVVLNFWASWCLECRDDHTYLDDAWQTYARRGVVFVGVDYEDSLHDARDFLKRYGGGQWPNLKDPGQQTAISYGVYGVPETYFIDRRGVVRYKSTGSVTPALLAQEIAVISRKSA
jgi:cytochrome c biogenesis protein CcmG/thiol:disulfide interchange protein DsbE